MKTSTCPAQSVAFNIYHIHIVLICCIVIMMEQRCHSSTLKAFLIQDECQGCHFLLSFCRPGLLCFLPWGAFVPSSLAPASHPHFHHYRECSFFPRHVGWDWTELQRGLDLMSLLPLTILSGRTKVLPFWKQERSRSYHRRLSILFWTLVVFDWTSGPRLF